MGFEVYDYRTAIRNVLVTPQIRARFMRMEAGELSGGRRIGHGHSHDLGHEVFLVLQGQAEFEIDGETQVLGPGQMCVALADQPHTIRNVGDEPVIMYLSVTPHIQPTHTSWAGQGKDQSPWFNPSTTYDVPPDRSTPTEVLADRYLDAFETLQVAVQEAESVQRAQVDLLKRAADRGDVEAATVARNLMWEALYPLFMRVYEMAEAWNKLTYRTADGEF